MNYYSCISLSRTCQDHWQMLTWRQFRLIRVWRNF